MHKRHGDDHDMGMHMGGATAERMYLFLAEAARACALSRTFCVCAADGVLARSLCDEGKCTLVPTVVSLRRLKAPCKLTRFTDALRTEVEDLIE